MKKAIVYVAVAGLAVGAVYLLYKRDKANSPVSAPEDKKVALELETHEESKNQKTENVDEIFRAKNESAQAVYERHTEAGKIMKESYTKIMEDFVEDFSDGKVVDEASGIKEKVIDSESVAVIKEIDSISDELDDLLK